MRIVATAAGMTLVLALGACQVSKDEANGTTSVTYNSDVAENAAADVGNLCFYQRQGFRLRSIDRDAFTAATGYPPGIVIDGIPLRDRVWFDRRVP